MSERPRRTLVVPVRFQDYQLQAPPPPPLSKVDMTAVIPPYPVGINYITGNFGLSNEIWNTNIECESQMAPITCWQDVTAFLGDRLREATGVYHGSGFDTGLLWESEANVLYLDKDLWESLPEGTKQDVRRLGANKIYVNASIPEDD